MYARSTYEGKNLPPVSRMGVVYGQKGNAPVTWKSAPYLPKNPFVSPLEIYNTLVHSANPKWTPKSGGIYHPSQINPNQRGNPPTIHPIHGIPMPPPQKIPKVILPPRLINPFRIEPLPSPEPIRTYPTPINCSEMKTCPDGTHISVCQSCPQYKKCPDGQTVPINQPCPSHKTEELTGGNALGSFIGSALMLLPFL